MKYVIVIPHYNHHRTLRAVAQGCLAQGLPVAVFDDGSTPSPEKQLEGLPVFLKRFEKNRGKGAVILDAARWAAQEGYTHLITVDADGQHNPQDIGCLLQASRRAPHALIIGKRRFSKEVPFASRFGRKFGGFWIHLQTGQAISDIQSGFRCYPVEILQDLSFWTRRYTFEVEVVARACWAGFGVVETDVSVAYPKDRVSHFSVWRDNLRLTVLNTYLTFRALLPIPHRQYRVEQTSAPAVKLSFWQMLVQNLKQPGNVTRNAFSAAWGIFCGSIALPGIRQVFLFWGSGWWNLNKILSIGFEKFCIGPFVPALCIEVGFFMRHGQWLTEFNLTTLGRQFLQRVVEWVLGSLVVAPVLAACTFGVVWVIGLMLHRSVCGRS